MLERRRVLHWDLRARENKKRGWGGCRSECRLLEVKSGHQSIFSSHLDKPLR